LVAEGALLFVPEDKAKEFNRWMDKGMWRNALDLMEWNDLMMQVIWDRAWPRSGRPEPYQIDLITFLGPDEFAAELAVLVGEQQLPINSVWATTPEILARQLQRMPDLIRVYHGFAQHQLMYGPTRGRFITDANQFGR
jgi:hypothetical protein